MKQNQSKLMSWLLLCIHLLLFQFPSFSSSSSFNFFLCHHDESDALLQFKSSFTLSPHYYNDGLYCDWGEPYYLKTATWKNGSDCCWWHGVKCDNISGHVVGLNLGCEGIQGTLHPNSTLYHLTHLQKLNLSYIEFLDSHFKFDEFTSLIHLDLSQCNFEGEIPLQMSHLSKLESLHLSGNFKLVWKEITLKRLVKNATNIRNLFLDYTNMSSISPNCIDFIFNQSSTLITLNLQQTGLSGKFEKSLCLPSSIQELYMSENYFLEGQPPQFGCNTSSLRVLDLSKCPFKKGPIPLSYSNFTHLTSLIMSYNNLNGSIPSSLLTLPHLNYLDLNSNFLTGQIPNVFPQSNTFQILDLSYNKIEGEIPSSLSNLQQLTHLILNNNLLNGTIPHGLMSSLPSLEKLYLGSNKLQGNIQESIFYLANLTDIDLSSNNLIGFVNFQHFSNLQNLVSLSLSQNSQLSVKFESNVNYNFSKLKVLDLSSVSLTEFPKLSGNLSSLDFLDLSNNRLSGSVPDWLIETVDSLTFLNLSQNLFTSLSINQFSRNKYQLRVLDVSFNLLEGDLPVSICNMVSLEVLNLAYNNLTGMIPQCLANIPSLQVLDLQMNRFYGSLPSNYTDCNVLHTLNLYGNQLEGHFPKSMSHCRHLRFLNLGSNKIEDNFPLWFETLRSMNVLVLRDNKLHGIIGNLKSRRHPFPSLIIFDISGNDFSGPLPTAYLKKFEAMKNATEFKYMSNSISTAGTVKWYYDSMAMATKGIKITLVKIPIVLVMIDLSRNRFEDEIPNVIGELHALIGLNLSHNMLTGLIPQSMGNLTNLESLDLSSNILSGVIPAELTNMKSLEVLDLSNNVHLEGEIPQGKQFNTFTYDSYEGDWELCGFPLSKKCGPEPEPEPEPEQHLSPPSANNIWSEEKFGFGFGWKPVVIFSIVCYFLLS